MRRGESAERTARQPQRRRWRGTVTAEEYDNYFCSYGDLLHQKDMLDDKARMDAYFSAIRGNAANFEGKVVLDLGCGTGVLALFAAQAGARKVYAVEATSVAKHAEAMAVSNGLSGVVTVIEGTIEEVGLPEQVDIIVSEWMGHFLLRESMIDSLLYARDKFLKSDGAMYPSSARMYLAPASYTDDEVESKGPDFEQQVEDWNEFVAEWMDAHGLDLSSLSGTYAKKAREAYLGVSQGVEIVPSDLLGPPVCVKEIDLLTATLEECSHVRHDDEALAMKLFAPGNGGEGGSGGRLPLTMFVGWFSVAFEGSPSSPSLVEVELSTGPEEPLGTHWGQEAFIVYPPLPLRADEDSIQCRFRMERQLENWRLYNIMFDYTITRAQGASESQEGDESAGGGGSSSSSSKTYLSCYKME